MYLDTCTISHDTYVLHGYNHWLQEYTYVHVWIQVQIQVNILNCIPAQGEAVIDVYMARL